MRKPLISVVIPAYNEERYLPLCLESLKKQTFTDFEIIVIDNNCTDKTAVIAKKFGVKMVKEKIQGMIPARNRGFDEARTDFIARTDADTIVSSNWLESIYQAFQANPQAVALTGSFTFPRVNPLYAFILKLFAYLCYYYLSYLLMGHFPLGGPNYALRKNAWEKVKGKIHLNDKLVHEDMDMSCHLSEIGKVLYVPSV
ncbi:hypothetical protein A2Y99_04230, partial [Candidatus Gottesmanbacteria bacterium RBG_13_37_7]